jgi:hypothetical protein
VSEHVTVFVEVASGSRKGPEEKTETRGFGNRADAERIIAAAPERARA